jgi:methylated-DNA-[protein]-cysteine S-methyltransferase
MALIRTFLASPLGVMLAIASPAGLCGLEFERPERATRLYRRLARWGGDAIEDVPADRFASARAWLDAYFGGRFGSEPPLPLDLRGTEFELDVWRALVAIPPGSTVTYGALARDLGRPDAARAVGMAVGANPVSLLVPCHRVIGSTGSLTGYGGGMERKQWLLRHEGARQARYDLLLD